MVGPVVKYAVELTGLDVGKKVSYTFFNEYDVKYIKREDILSMVWHEIDETNLCCIHGPWDSMSFDTEVTILDE